MLNTLMELGLVFVQCAYLCNSNVNTRIGYTQTVVVMNRVAIPQNTRTNVNSLYVTLSTMVIYIIAVTLPVLLSTIGSGTATQVEYSLNTGLNYNDYYNQACELHTGSVLEYQQSLQTTAIFTCV